MIALTTFATAAYAPAQEGLAKSALHQGAHRVSKWRPEDLRRTEFYRRNRDILDRPRGAGYWLWKPYIILAELERLREGDFLIYYDCGHPEKPYRIKRPLSILTDWCHEHLGGMLPGVYLPRYGRNARWTKGECFAVMGCQEPLYREHPQVQATFSVWEKHDASLAFVEEWLHWCSNPAALIDDRIDPAIPDAEDFIEHRHDQSVLTLLTLKHRLKSIGSPLECHKGERRVTCLIDRIIGEAPVESFAHLFPTFAQDFPELAKA